MAPRPLAPCPSAPALLGGNGDSSLALTFHSSCHCFASMNEIKHDMGTEVEHMLKTPATCFAMICFSYNTHTHTHTSAVWTLRKCLIMMRLSWCGASFLLRKRSVWRAKYLTSINRTYLHCVQPSWNLQNTSSYVALTFKRGGRHFKSDCIIHLLSDLLTPPALHFYTMTSS